MSFVGPSAVLEDMRLSNDAVRRILISLIMAEQESLHKKGVITGDHLLGPKVFGRNTADVDGIKITEEVLGFDSLGILDVILAVNRFFQLDASGAEDYLLIERDIGSWVRLVQKHRDLVADQWSFGFQTSGSAGKPKTVIHPAKVLWTEMAAQHQAPLRILRPPGRVITLVPPHHIYGFLFGCVLPEVAGVDHCDLHLASPTAAFREARSGDLIVGTPHNWDVLSKTGKIFATGVHGVTSAGPSTPGTWNVVSENGLAGLTEIFGSTETGGLASRTSPDDAFILLPHLSMVDGVIPCPVTGSPLPLQDNLVWTSARHFRIAGRIDHVVQVAGVNVSPALVANRIKLIAGVADAVVRLDDDRLKAFVVPAHSQSEAGALRQSIHRELYRDLPAVARPTSIDIGPALPRNAMGKLSDWTPATAGKQGQDAPVDEVENKPSKRAPIN